MLKVFFLKPESLLRNSMSQLFLHPSSYNLTIAKLCTLCPTDVVTKTKQLVGKNVVDN